MQAQQGSCWALNLPGRLRFPGICFSAPHARPLMLKKKEKSAKPAVEPSADSASKHSIRSFFSKNPKPKSTGTDSAPGTPRDSLSLAPPPQSPPPQSPPQSQAEPMADSRGYISIANKDVRFRPPSRLQPSNKRSLKLAAVSAGPGREGSRACCRGASPGAPLQRACQACSGAAARWYCMQNRQHKLTRSACSPLPRALPQLATSRGRLLLRSQS